MIAWTHTRGSRSAWSDTGVSLSRDHATFARNRKFPSRPNDTPIPAPEIERFARAYATTQPSLLRPLIGIEHHRNGGMQFRTIGCLPVLTGAWRHRGGGLARSTHALHFAVLDLKHLEMPEVHVPGVRTLNMRDLGKDLGDPHLSPPVRALMVYGANPVLPKHEDLAPMPVSPYAASKLATEQYALAWAASYGLAALAFRFFNVFGPLQPAGHDYAAVVPAFVDAALAGRPLPVHGDGTQSRDFTFVGDVVRVLADAAEHRVAHPTPVNLAFGTRTSLLELISQLEAVLGPAR